MSKELDKEIDQIIETMEDDDSGFVFNKHIATYIFGIAMGILISLVVIAGIGESQLEHKNFNDTITTTEIIQRRSRCRCYSSLLQSRAITCTETNGELQDSSGLALELQL